MRAFVFPAFYTSFFVVASEKYSVDTFSINLTVLCIGEGPFRLSCLFQVCRPDWWNNPSENFNGLLYLKGESRNFYRVPIWGAHLMAKIVKFIFQAEEGR